MTFLPIVGRELRVRARRKATHWFRVAAAAVAIGMVGFLLMMMESTSAPANLGATIFRVITGVAFLYCLLEGTRHTADCLSEEKRAGTLGLLFLTDLKGYDVVLGKFTAASLNSFYGLLAVFPPLAVPLVLGGVTSGEFWRLAAALLNGLFFSLSAGMLVSTLSRQERMAGAVTLLLVSFMSGLLPAAPTLVRLLSRIGWLGWLGGWDAVLEPLAVLSPTTSLVFGFDAFYLKSPGEYWSALLVTHLLSWLWLGTASGLLPRCWQDAPAASKRLWWAELFPGRMRPQENAQRREARCQLLARNPILWLAGQHEVKRLFLWVGVGTVGLAGVVWSVLRYGDEDVWPVLMLVGVIFHLALSVAGATHACYLFAGARDSGMLELLLSTALSAREIVDGHLESVRRLFYWPLVVFVFLELVMLALQLGALEYRGEAVVPTALGVLGVLLIGGVMVLDLYATSVFGLWLGLSMKKPSHALSRTLSMVLLPHFVGLCFGVLWPLMGIVKNLVFVFYGREQLRRQFRAVVVERYPVLAQGK